MNSFNRVKALMEGRMPDRVPVFCNLLDQGASELGIPLKKYYSRGEFIAEGQLCLQKKYKYDNLWAYSYAAADAEMLGSKYTVFYENGPPNAGDLVIKSEDDIDKLAVSSAVLETKAFKDSIRTLELLKKEKGGEIPVMASVVGSFSLPSILMGMDKWLELLFTGPEKTVRKILKKCSDFCIMKSKALHDEGADFIVYINPLSTATFISVKQFEYKSLEWIIRDLSSLNMKSLVYFSGGGLLNPMLELILENISPAIMYISPMDDVSEAKRIINKKSLLSAPVNDIELINSSDRQIENKVRRIMSAGKPGGGFLFGTLLMPLSVPEQNIKSMISAAFKYGKY